MKSSLITSYTEQLTEQFRLMILSGEFEPGQRLREIPLADQFGISRGPIRDTFLQLTREGLLVAKPNAGVRVAEPPSLFKRKTLVALRRKLEGDCLKEALRQNPRELLAQLTENMTRYYIACQKEDLEEVVKIDMAFHRIIVSGADDSSLLTTWVPLISQMFLKYSRHHSLIESYQEHAGILEALNDQDAALAARLLREHIV